MENLKEKAFDHIDKNNNYDVGRKQRLKMLVEKLILEREN